MSGSNGLNLKLSSGVAMEIDTTGRGFGIAYFTDGNGMRCNIQESSACRSEGLLWLGAAQLEVQVFKGCGWETLDIQDLPEVAEVCGNERMHLTQSNVKELLPLLTYFAEHGTLPNV